MVRTLRPSLLALGLWLGGCTAANDAQTVLRENVAGHRMLVQLEPVQTSEATQFAHPVAGDPQELAQKIDGLLAELAFGRPKGKKLTRLMSPADRERLAQGLSRGLTSAGPDERVVFVLSIDDGDDVPWFTPDERVTRGIAFVKRDGRLHVAFDLIDTNVDPNKQDPYDPTERAQTRARLVSKTGEDIGPGDKGARRLGVTWSLLTPMAADTAPKPQGEADPVSPEHAAKLELLDELLRDKIIDREEYERRRTRLSSPERADDSATEAPGPT